MSNAWWSGIALAAVIAALGLVAALVDPAHWYVMFPIFIIAGGAYLLSSAPSARPAGEGVSSRRPTPVFGAPPAIYAGGWGAVVLLTGLVLTLDIYVPGLGVILLFVWIAAFVIVLFFASQIRGRVTNGS